MAVMIKGMEIPKDCPFCPMAHWWMHELKGRELMQRYVPKTDIEYWQSNTRPSWCPLVEVEE